MLRMPISRPIRKDQERRREADLRRLTRVVSGDLLGHGSTNKI